MTTSVARPQDPPVRNWRSNSSLPSIKGGAWCRISSTDGAACLSCSNASDVIVPSRAFSLQKKLSERSYGALRRPRLHSARGMLYGEPALVVLYKPVDSGRGPEIGRAHV